MTIIKEMLEDDPLQWWTSKQLQNQLYEQFDIEVSIQKVSSAMDELIKADAVVYRLRSRNWGKLFNYRLSNPSNA